MLVDEISEIVAKRLNLNPLMLKSINRIQWKFLLEEMQSGKLNTVQVFYVGKFTKSLKLDENNKHKKYVKVK